VIVARIDVSGGRAVLPAGADAGGSPLTDAGDPVERLELYALAGEVAVTDLDAARGTGSNRDLIERMVRRAPCRVAGRVGDPGTARAWLDAGARRVVLDAAASPDGFAGLPRERLVAAIDAGGSSAVEGLSESVRRRAAVAGGVLVQLAGPSPVVVLDEGLTRLVAAAGAARVTVAGGIATAAEVARLDRLGADAEVGAALAAGSLSLADAIAAPLPRGRGLWPTVVCDENGAALGLAWSSLRSLRRAVADRRGVYWSRSRRELWVKGATSGNVQVLLGVALDCDRDALRFTVGQEGAGFCHTGTRSCWGDDFDLGALERAIRGRMTAPVEGSGTSRLLADPRLLAAKLVEEARELADAGDTDAAVHEAADLLYFGLAALVAKGGQLSDVVAELERRSLRLSRRPMQAKREAGPGEAGS
jgi:phosphoribosyl-AMP cyclohydrolase / phosphoribosyl-ATP pyrophosphohydrolase